MNCYIYLLFFKIKRSKVVLMCLLMRWFNRNCRQLLHITTKQYFSQLLFFEKTNTPNVLTGSNCFGLQNALYHRLSLLSNLPRNFVLIKAKLAPFCLIHGLILGFFLKQQ